jgi:hypothetical protein
LMDERSGIDQALYRWRGAGTIDQLVVWRDGGVDGCMMGTSRLDGGSANGVEYLAARSRSWSRRYTVRDSWGRVGWCRNAGGNRGLRCSLNTANEIRNFGLP